MPNPAIAMGNGVAMWQSSSVPLPHRATWSLCSSTPAADPRDVVVYDYEDAKLP
jgi:hypothetical protein